MNSIGNDAKAAAALDRQELTRFKMKMDGLKERLGDSKGRDAQLKEACKDFEAIFISKIWKEMRNSVPKEGYLHSKQEEKYLSMFDKDFSEKMASDGGIGLADMLYDQLSTKLKEASRDSLTGKADIRPLNEEREGIPLRRERNTSVEEQTEELTLDDWIGDDAETSGSGNFHEGDTAAYATQAPEQAAVAPQAPVTEMDVKAQVEQLARRLEREAQGQVGRKLAYLK